MNRSRTNPLTSTIAAARVTRGIVAALHYDPRCDELRDALIDALSETLRDAGVDPKPDDERGCAAFDRAVEAGWTSFDDALVEAFETAVTRCFAVAGKRARGAK